MIVTIKGTQGTSSSTNERTMDDERSGEVGKTLFMTGRIKLIIYFRLSYSITV